jgi:hypothetical protein
LSVLFRTSMFTPTFVEVSFLFPLTSCDQLGWLTGGIMDTLAS